ncbi:fasciclin domain-containing protein [Pedobacter frigoris]|uniref:fasciclin domain-containing protein n=1 Tax=Pedobacter frigoris TaxID=2571272 RepID=UPI00292F1261|nr:fasciclin domain-containing protein [Pedobacter frigoris]
MLKKFKSVIALFAVLSCLLIACKKNYFEDTGVHNAKYNGSILQYLKSKPVLFDSLVMAIDAAGMNDVFEKENVTFFAPANSCIYKAVKWLNEDLRTSGKDTVSQLSQIKPEVWKAMLSQYVFKGSYLLKDVPQIDTLALNAFSGQGYTSYGGRSMNLGVFYNDANGIKYVGYRQLILSFIPDFSNPKTGLINTPVATSDIQPTNGVLHVLRYQNHSFGFESRRFITSAISAGIGKAGQ